MRFGACKIDSGELFVGLFEKEYKDYSFQEIKQIFSTNKEILKECEFFDVVIPASKTLFFSKIYPPVKKEQIEKIIKQDIESETVFDSKDLIIDFASFEETTFVYAVKKSDLVEIINTLGEEFKDKIRTIVPENALFFKDNQPTQTIFLGIKESVFFDKNGQIITKKGFNNIKKSLSDIFGESDDKELFMDWFLNLTNITSETSGDSKTVGKILSKFFKETISYFDKFQNPNEKLQIVVGFELPKDAENLIFEALEFNSNIEIVHLTTLCQKVADFSEHSKNPNFAKEEFSYKGGFEFLKQRILIIFILFILSFLVMFISMEIRISNLDTLSNNLDKKSSKIIKSTLGKTYPSMKQALSIMIKTIKGGTLSKDKKKLYPYSSLYISEQIFPAIAFKGSTIEIKALTIKNDGKIRIAGFSQTLDDINKMIENLQKNKKISEINKGQISNRRQKNYFSISFRYGNEKPKDKKTLRRKK